MITRALILLCTVLLLGLGACQPSNPPPTPLPTKEKTIDRVKADIDKAQKKADEIRQGADSDDLLKKGY